ncbi:MFS transporter, DHA2 family, multidrug resistance protein [Trichlorobacter thiogenes]|uniref:MFS transporter, DHA2 family, multidrug resistance protein n=1 Tax=Trichlorobacter thiogenes TaxID=115783 RepID=A0A1T4RN25_9BACT|nr:DHA2 family efflux MFS transporter permease subunit [Trichlorobacter thiogenes]SKA17400.1 MFS transporter, DHA2 family, multidrug resistance protein [Trichlorobacter thiogenes]
MTEARTINKWLIVITVMLPTIMEIIDTSVANVALPYMQGSLNAGTEEITWVLTSYLVSNAVVLPMTGWLARMFGRKRFLLTCITLFTLSSVLCGAAPNLGTLILFRVLQGAAGGALIPISQAILLETFPPKQHGIAMAIFGVGAMTGPIVGPALGGWITDQMNWRWIFYINIPIGLIAAAMCTLFIFDSPYLREGMAKVRKVDYWGLFLLTVSMGALQVVLDKGQQEDWFNSNFIISFSVITVVSLVALIWVELTHEQPIVNLRLFKSISFSAGNLVMFVVGFGLYSSIMLIPMFLQTLMGYSATDAGMVMAPGGIATLLTMPFVGAMLQKRDGRKIVLVGLIISACSMYLMQGLNLQASYWAFVWPRIVLGIGLAMIFVPLTTVTLSGIARQEMGNATGVFNLLRNIGGSVGIAIAATLLSRLSQFYQTSLSAHVTPYNPVFQMRLSELKQALIAKGMQATQADQTAIGMIYGMVRKQAATLAYNRIFFIIGLAFLAIIPLLLLLKRPSHQTGPVEIH